MSPTLDHPSPDAPSCTEASCGTGSRALPRGRTIELPLQPGQVLVCTQGLLWLRPQGDADDHLLRTGQHWQAGAAAAVVVQALADARFSVDAG